ncbi:uncharacterized protein PGTG_22755 [Puccinia graminis f. sp. tritici CRL 75-36-700-3]|uniref:ATP-dependent DNA helicase sgs1 n=1 Tax=Puccinia graminis f. sp. tritici (strain CRL 75-36-700-3 / race SCCL) TaxID=418459 RepID=H6QVI0_PUCGT|nr:uncharacterized protein PGTG_22755 [Puccinia graminis f. sp. tritici CRL 75-36-700-3]EHS62995.1 hypothetical protein PGTG_22755 [Puccinia graminis f. sp. tritici CRL 75-36-700-3]
MEVPKKTQACNEDELKGLIERQGLKKYNQPCKPRQVETVASLIRGRNTFLLAATGFGKSRIPELYLDLLCKDRSGDIQGVVVVLNPLDALGDNQVAEKIQAGFTAINLTQLNFIVQGNPL